MTTSVACRKQPMTALIMQRGVIEIHSAVMTYSTILTNVLWHSQESRWHLIKKPCVRKLLRNYLSMNSLEKNLPIVNAKLIQICVNNCSRIVSSLIRYRSNALDNISLVSQHIPCLKKETFWRHTIAIPQLVIRLHPLTDFVIPFCLQSCSKAAGTCKANTTCDKLLSDHTSCMLTDSSCTPVCRVSNNSDCIPAVQTGFCLSYRSRQCCCIVTILAKPGGRHAGHTTLNKCALSSKGIMSWQTLCVLHLSII